jgi:cell wall-associated NlpC family hydrolase
MSIDRPDGPRRPSLPWEGKLNPAAEVAAMDRDGDLALAADEFVRAQVGGDPMAPANRREALRWLKLHQAYAGEDDRLDAPELAALVAAHGAEGPHPFDSRLDDLAARHPHLRRLMADARVGDLVFFQGAGPVAALTKGPWTHVGLVVAKGPPLRMIEAVGGMTGVSSNLGKVRASTFGEFLGDSDLAAGKAPTFALVRPTRDPREIAAAVAFARAQVGKPYDFAFTGGGDAYYCSELVYAAFNQNPRMPAGTPPRLGLARDPGRNATVREVKDTIARAGLDERQVGGVLEDLLGGKPLEKLRAADRAGGMAITGAYNAGVNWLAARFDHVAPVKGRVDPTFVSPTLLLEGSRAALVGLYAPE